MPKFFILQVDFMTKTVALNMFPSSHRPGEAVEVCREIGKWLLANVEYTMDAYLSFSLFGISEEDITLLTELVEATARKVQTDYTFLSCSCLRIVIHDTTIQVSSLPSYLVCFGIHCPVAEAVAVSPIHKIIGALREREDALFLFSRR